MTSPELQPQQDPIETIKSHIQRLRQDVSIVSEEEYTRLEQMLKTQYSDDVIAQAIDEMLNEEVLDSFTEINIQEYNDKFDQKRTSDLYGDFDSGVPQD